MADGSAMMGRQPGHQPHLAIDALNLRWGGGVTVMDRLARAFADSGMAVRVLAAPSLTDTGLAGHPGITLITVPGTQRPWGAARARMTRLGTLTDGADWLMSFNYHSPSALPQLTCHFNVIPYLPFGQRRRAVGLVRAILQRRAAIRALDRSDLNFFESQHLMDLASRAHGRAARGAAVTHVGADLPRLLPENTGAAPDAPLIAVTSGARHKRNDLLLETWRRLRAGPLPGLVLEIAGKREAILAGLSPTDRAEAGASPDIRFLGYLDRAGLYRALSRARALVTFSELESFYMVAIEAMSAGCPVVAPRISSIEESAGPAGLLFEPGDVAGAVAHVARLSDRTARDGMVARGHDWARGFDADRCAAAFVARFREMAGETLGQQAGQR